MVHFLILQYLHRRPFHFSTLRPQRTIELLDTEKKKEERTREREIGISVWCSNVRSMFIPFALCLSSRASFRLSLFILSTIRFIVFARMKSIAMNGVQTIERTLNANNLCHAFGMRNEYNVWINAHR